MWSFTKKKKISKKSFSVSVNEVYKKKQLI